MCHVQGLYRGLYMVSCIGLFVHSVMLYRSLYRGLYTVTCTWSLGTNNVTGTVAGV